MLAPDTLGSVDQRAWDGFQTAADSLATQVLATPTAKAKVLPCTTDNATCIRQFITAFGRKAFRRPLTTAEVTRFQNLYTNRATLTQNGTFDQAVAADPQGVPDVALVPQQRGDLDGVAGAARCTRSTAGRWRRASPTRCGERCRTTCCSPPPSGTS